MARRRHSRRASLRPTLTSVTNIDRGVVTWSGPGVVGGGLTVMYAKPGGSLMSHMRDFFEALKTILPNNLQLTYPTSGDTIDSATGNLVGAWTGPTLTPTIGTSSASYASPAGACVNWVTGTIIPAHAGKPPRLLRGRTFLAPLVPVAFDVDGTLSGPGFSQIKAAADALVVAGAASFVVWHRPTSPGGTDGAVGDVLSARLRDKAAVLTSRRD